MEGIPACKKKLIYHQWRLTVAQTATLDTILRYYEYYRRLQNKWKNKNPKPEERSDHSLDCKVANVFHDQLCNKICIMFSSSSKKRDNQINYCRLLDMVEGQEEGNDRLMYSDQLAPLIQENPKERLNTLKKILCAGKEEDIEAFEQSIESIEKYRNQRVSHMQLYPRDIDCQKAEEESNEDIRSFFYECISSPKNNLPFKPKEKDSNLLYPILDPAIKVSFALYTILKETKLILIQGNEQHNLHLDFDKTNFSFDDFMERLSSTKDSQPFSMKTPER